MMGSFLFALDTTIVNIAYFTALYGKIILGKRREVGDTYKVVRR